MHSSTEFNAGGPDPVQGLSRILSASSLAELEQAFRAHLVAHNVGCSVWIVQYDARQGQLRPRFANTPELLNSALQEQILRQIAVDGATDIGSDASDSNVSKLPITRQLNLFPLSTDGKKYGYAFVDQSIVDRELADLEILFDVLGTVLERIDLIALYSAQHEQDSIRLSGFNRITNVLKVLDLEPLLVEVTNLAMSILSGGAAALQMPDRKTEKLNVAVEMGVGESQLGEFIHKTHGPICEYVAENEVVWMTDTQDEFSEFEPSELLQRINAFVVLPLRTKHGVGCITIVDPENASNCHLETLLILSRLSCLCIDNAILHDEIIAQTVHKQHLMIAGQVQQQLMPDSRPVVPGFDVFGVNLPADDTSGDYFDFLQLDNNRFCFVLADATGHGIGAALIATTARAMLRTLLLTDTESSLCDLIEKVNSLMHEDLPDDKFLTLFLGVIDTETKALSYLNAGHEPCPVIYHPSTDTANELSSHGLPLGMFEGVSYDEAQTIHFKGDEVIFICSDGIPEAHNRHQEFFGKERINTLLSSCCDQGAMEIVGRVTRDVLSFIDGEEQNDDITLMVIKPD